MPVQEKCEIEVGKLLKTAGVRFSDLSEVPLQTIRNVQRGAFPDMRMIDLAPDICDQSLGQPILEDLLCTRVGYQGPSPAHYIPRPKGSPDNILIVCTDGRGWLEIHGKLWVVQKHDAFVIPRDVPHVYGADPEMPWSNYWVHFQGRQGLAFTSLIASDPASPVVHLYRSEEVVASIEQLYQSMSSVHTYAALVSSSGGLSQLLSRIQLRMHTSELKVRTSEESAKRTIEFMQKNLDSKLSLQDLAHVAGMSANHYGMVFRKCHGHSPVDYFNRLKIQKACELLRTTDMRICEIGEALGFFDPYYFSRLFKKLMGKSPREYR